MRRMPLLLAHDTILFSRPNKLCRSTLYSYYHYSLLIKIFETKKKDSSCSTHVSRLPI